MQTRPVAKINLSLSVGPVGRDGYHPLESVFLRIGLADELTFAPGDGATQGDSLSVSGLPGCPVDGNLVLRALALARRALGGDLPLLTAHLDKRIPMQAGLGGGSSDAATTVDGALELWGAGLAPDVLDEIALQLGADVPFFMRRVAAAFVSGRGEQVRPTLAIPTTLGILMVTPPIALSTAEVFQRYDDLAPADRPHPAIDESLLSRLPDTAGELREANDLWWAATSLAPKLASLRDTLERRTGQPWLLSGSGSTLFALYPSPEAAAAAGRQLATTGTELIAGSIVNAVDLTGPDPVWRYPWPSEQ